MKIRALKDEDFVNYKKPSMFIGTSQCNWKCCQELNIDVSICQNSQLACSEIIDISIHDLITRYLSNDITKAIVFGGLEPFDQYDDIYQFIKFLRINFNCHDDIVIYTGYNKNEIENRIVFLSKFDNIIIKYGRYIPNQEKHFDEILGVSLVSDNQYAEKIS